MIKLSMKICNCQFVQINRFNYNFYLTNLSNQRCLNNSGYDFLSKNEDSEKDSFVFGLIVETLE